jgi:pimeloyl-[acyl-carrier protein] methyl ester esterase
MKIILLPGMDGTGDLFQPLLDLIPPNITPHVVSYPTDEALSYDELLTLLEQRLSDELQPMVLVAESFSGPLALRYAVLHPAKLRGVVLCASFVRCPVPRWVRLTPSIFFKLPPPAFVVRALLTGRDSSDALVRTIRNAIRRVRPHVLAHRVKQVMSLDCTAVLRACPVPMLYLAADLDVVVKKSSIERMLAQRTDISVRTIAGPHLLLQDNPASAWHAIESFVQSLHLTSALAGTSIESREDG